MTNTNKIETRNATNDELARMAGDPWPWNVRDEAKRELARRAELAGPAVGDGVTMCHFTDRHAGTVIKRTPKTVTVQRDKATRVDGNGMSDAQQYEYERDPEGATYVFSLRKNGTWRQRGHEEQGTRLVAGRREYYDFSF